jgi:hypothetical protein
MGDVLGVLHGAQQALAHPSTIGPDQRSRRAQAAAPGLARKSSSTSPLMAALAGVVEDALEWADGPVAFLSYYY